LTKKIKWPHPEETFSRKIYKRGHIQQPFWSRDTSACFVWQSTTCMNYIWLDLSRNFLTLSSHIIFAANSA